MGGVKYRQDFKCYAFTFFTLDKFWEREKKWEESKKEEFQYNTITLIVAYLSIERDWVGIDP